MFSNRQPLTPDRIRECAVMCGIAIALAFLFTLALGFTLTHAQTLGASTSIFCNTEDQITAVIESKEIAETVELIDKAVPNACASLTAQFYAGKRSKTVRGKEGLYDITPVLLVAIQQDGAWFPGAGMTQWSAFKSDLMEVTWKPEYSKNPPAIQQWFREQKLMPKARIRFAYDSCCDNADRYHTKFLPSKSGDWAYWNIEAKKWLPIPSDIIHTEGIHALNPKDDNLPEFNQMRAEGVLMAYKGVLTCFWPPEAGG